MRMNKRTNERAINGKIRPVDMVATEDVKKKHERQITY